MTVAELSASVPSGEYELVRGRGTSEDTEIDFSNPLYAEPEREVVSAIYESVSCVRFLGFCNISQITGTNVRVIYPDATPLKFSATWEKSVGVNFTSACVQNLSLQFTRDMMAGAHSLRP